MEEECVSSLRVKKVFKKESMVNSANAAEDGGKMAATS